MRRPVVRLTTVSGQLPRSCRSCLNWHAQYIENARHHHVCADSDHELDIALGIEVLDSSIRQSRRDKSVAQRVRELEYEPLVVCKRGLVPPVPYGSYDLVGYTGSTRHGRVVKPLILRRVLRRGSQNRELAKRPGRLAIVPQRPQEVAPGPYDRGRVRQRAVEIELGGLAPSQYRRDVVRQLGLRDAPGCLAYRKPVYFGLVLVCHRIASLRPRGRSANFTHSEG